MRLSAWEKLHFNMGVLQVDEVLGDRNPGMEDLKALRYTSRVIAESMRLYPQPPVLIRRALKDDMFGDIKVRLQHSIGLCAGIWYQTLQTAEVLECRKDGIFPVGTNNLVMYPISKMRWSCAPAFAAHW